MINPYMNQHPSVQMTSSPATHVAKFMEQNLNVDSPRYGKSLFLILYSSGTLSHHECSTKKWNLGYFFTTSNLPCLIIILLLCIPFSLPPIQHQSWNLEVSPHQLQALLSANMTKDSLSIPCSLNIYSWIMPKANQENKQMFASNKGYSAKLFIVLNIRLAKQTLTTNTKQSH